MDESKRNRMKELLTVEEPLALALLEAGHEIQRQVIVGCGRIDIFDETAFELIECKAVGNTSSIVAAIKQLKRYRPYFPGPQLAVAVPRIENDAIWLADAMEKTGIRFIEIQRGVGV
jgi:hypothetical protein